MRKVLLLASLFALSLHGVSAYSDHRVANLDSLENVAVGFTAEKIASASDEELSGLVMAYNGLMNGYLQINKERSILFARKQIALSSRKGWFARKSDAERIIGQHHWAAGQYDSALFYYGLALADADSIAAIAAVPGNPKGYNEETADDQYSAIYGAMGNCYNMMDSIPKAMEYYRKAGEIFRKRGWNESSAILYYNMGETYREQKDYSQAKECYDTSMQYALASGDSLQISSALKGLGALNLETGHTRKALFFLRRANEYYSLHNDQEFRSWGETLDLMGKVLALQKKQFKILAFTATGIVILLLLLLFFMRTNWILRRKNAAADKVIEEAMDGAAVRGNGDDPSLTSRENEILALISQGYTSSEIADRLYLSLPTIKWYRKKLLEKFEASNMAELVSKAKERGIV